MYLRKSNQILATPVAFSERLYGAINYMRNNPGQFIVSTVTSMVTFMAVRSVLLLSASAAGFAISGGLLGAVAIAMATSAVIAGAKGTAKAMRERRQRRQELRMRSEMQGIMPTTAELAAANNVVVTDIIMDTINQSLFSGFMSGLTGGAVGLLASSGVEFGLNFPGGNSATTENTMNISGGYRAYLEDLASDESGVKGYLAENSRSFIGKYQFGEPGLVEAGFYEWTDNRGRLVDRTNWLYNNDIDPNKLTHRNTWEGVWTEEARSLGVNSKEAFLNNPDAQEIAILKYNQATWRQIIALNLDEYIGKEYIDADGKRFTVTEAGLLRGAHLGGAGNVRDFLENPNLNDASDGATRVSQYMNAGEHFDVPFEKNNPDQLPFYDYVLPVRPEDVRRLSSHMGMRNLDVRGGVHFHSGIDFSAPVGTDVFAVADGTVTGAGWENPNNPKKGFGQRIRLSHADGTTSVYGHLTGIDVREGQSIKQGMKIGDVGNTGTSTGPHLHFEIEIDNPRKANNPYPEFQIVDRDDRNRTFLDVEKLLPKADIPGYKKEVRAMGLSR
jgi:murein DD-endopeptidase MepM/ murein hydrolase activator NlpD